MSRPRHSSPTFERSYDILNAAQKKAVDTVEGPVLVIAGPGTGKTTILTLRIANILRLTDTAPDSILALTFTESGAHAMRRKLIETIGPAGYKVGIHTFHGFAARIIERHPDYFPRIIGSSLIAETEQTKIIEHIISSREIEALRPFGDQGYYVSPVLREIHVLKRENISPEALAHSVETEAEADDTDLSATEREKRNKRIIKNRELAFVYAEYEKALAKGKYYDFDDMLLELIRALEGNPEFKLIIQEQFQYILADEHQDANAAQNRILELLSDFHDSPNLFIVGDDKQAIYRFQGASLENFLYFSEKYPDACIIDLEHNYRSHQNILDASHSLIVKNPSVPGREHARLRSLMIGGSPIRVLEFSALEDEIDGVAERVRELVSNGESAEEIAILYRDNRHAGPIAAALVTRAIPHRIESDHDILDEIDVVKIRTLCAAINDPSDSQALAGVLFLSELGCDPADVAEICTLASRQRVALHRAIKKSAPASIRAAYARIVTWSHEARTMSFPEFMQKLIQETGLVAAAVSAPDSLDRLNSLQAFHDYVATAARAAKTFYLRDFMEHLEVTTTHGISARRGYAEHVTGVRLMTAHRAKGLEFNHVFIIHAIDGIWGNRSSRNLFQIPATEHARNTGRIDDERRLFYVAMTRARESVTVTRARSDGAKEAVPSQFVSEIDPALVVFEKIHDEPAHVRISKIFAPRDPEVTRSTGSLMNADFITSKFTSQPLSVTHLNNYLECPWRYFFVNLVRIPQAESKHQLYGTAIHAALRSFFDTYKKGRILTVKQLVTLFRRQSELLPFSADDFDDSEKKGVRALEGYYKTYAPVWNRDLVTEYAVRGAEVKVDKKVSLELSGKLDKIEIVDGRKVNVVDYKTGKPKSRNQIEGKVKSDGNGEGNYFRQLAFYKLLLDGEGKYDMVSGEIDFIEPNDRGIYKKEQFEITDKDTTKVEAEIVSMAKDILSLSFIASKCKDKKCEYCKLGRLVTGK